MKLRAHRRLRYGYWKLRFRDALRRIRKTLAYQQARDRFQKGQP